MKKPTDTKKYRRHLKQLESDFETWKAQWQEIAEYILPYSAKYLSDASSKSKDGKKKTYKIINGTAYKALTTLSSGMQGGMTSPSRPWFSLGLKREELMEIGPVRLWLRAVRDLMLNVFSKSNFYGAVHTLYGDLGAFGTAVMLIEEDFDTVIRCRPYAAGEYYLSINEKYIPDTVYRCFEMSAKQLELKFGEEKLSNSVKSALKNKQYEDLFEIIHCITPNRDRSEEDENEYLSLYFEKSTGLTDTFLRISGYRTKPFAAPRWEVKGTDTYGISPCMQAVSDVKMLQVMEEKKLKALGKMVDPPMNAPASMKGKGTIIAGGVNYVDIAQGNQGMAPVYQVNPNLQNIAYEIDRVESRIRNYLFNNLFLAILDQNKNMTATEVNQRTQEKLLVLGSVVDRTGTEMLDVIIDRTFDIMSRFDLIPPPPPEIQGEDISITYISMLAQAQKITGVTAIEQTAAFVGNMAAANPEVLDKFNFDQSVDEYAKAVGGPPSLIRPDDEVEVIREMRAKQQQQLQQQEMMANAAQGAKTLSEANIGENNALEVLTGRA